MFALTVALAASWLAIGGLVWLLYLVTKRHGRMLAAYQQLRDHASNLENALTTRTATSQSGIAGDAEQAIEYSRTKQNDAAEDARRSGLPIRDTTLKRDGLAPGTKAPNFHLPDLNGVHHSLREFRGKRLMLVFSDPECGPCQALAPSLQAVHERRQGYDLMVLMVSRGDQSANRQKAEEKGLTFPILLQKRWEVSRQYAMFATPIGYLINERGVLSSGVAIGSDAILGLVD